MAPSLDTVGVKLTLTALILGCLIGPTKSLDNGLGFTPAMGWNSWNLFKCFINETIVTGVADAILEKGLDKLGYTYINLDDCWMLKRDLDGYIEVDSRSFPSGMKYLADYSMHSRGLKFGLYSSAGTLTCQGLPGSFLYEKEDATMYAKWDVDYLKLDNCYNENLGDKQGTIYRYGRMRDALNATGRPIYYSICNWGQANIWEYGKELGNAWRTTGDICDEYQGRDCAVMDLLDQNADRLQYSAPGGFNDLDMLEIGNGGMTTEEYRSHFSAWVVAKSPLLLGNDVRIMSEELLSIVSNPEVIAINQDPLGLAAHRVWKSKFTVTVNGKKEEKFLDVWAGPVSNDERVLLVLNRGNARVDSFGVDLGIVYFDDFEDSTGKRVHFPVPSSAAENYFELDPEGVLRPKCGRMLGPKRKVKARDLWRRKDAGFHTSVVQVGPVEAHDAVMFRISTAPKASDDTWWQRISSFFLKLDMLDLAVVTSLLSIFALFVYKWIWAKREGQIRLPTPAMGWNTWNHFNCYINENIIKEMTEAIIAKGLDKVGYIYMNLDDCWMSSSRDAKGYLQYNKDTFPSGLKKLSDYGLKFGIYSSAGTKTCQGLPASYLYEKEDAEKFAEWGVDYLKLDNCYNEGLNNKEGTIHRYSRMRDALNATGRPIYYSLCNWGEANSWEYAQDLGNAWRTTWDICDAYQGVWCSAMDLLDQNADRLDQSAPGGFGDLDMLEVGNGGMTIPECRSHFSIWAAAKSPLILGNDIRTMSDEHLEIVNNTEIIAVNQDPLGLAAKRIWKSKFKVKNEAGNKEEKFLDVWAGPLAHGERVLVVLNRGETHVENFAVDLGIVYFDDFEDYDGNRVSFPVPPKDVEKFFGLDNKGILRPIGGKTLGPSRKVKVRNLWEKKDKGFFTGVVNVGAIAPHDVTVLRISPAPKTFTEVAWSRLLEISPLEGVLLTGLFIFVAVGVWKAVAFAYANREGQVRLE
ncbi:hypothetical protein HDU96_006444 [Phlyctochytrium bullatum]|nr:hypothetical protein HDU96_006444 [Phlyctochytrium bullatum]